MKLAVLFLLAAAALASPYNWSSPPCKLLAANATAHPPDDTLVVGVLYSLQRSVTLEASAPSTVMSVCMAMTQAQEAGDLGRYNVSLVLFDDKDLSSMGPVAAGLFSAIPVVTVIGGDSSRITMTLLDGNATHPGLTASGIPLISGLSTSPMLSDKSKYPRFMRTCTSVALSSLAMVQMFSKYGITRVVGMGNDDSYGQGGVQKIVTYAARATPPVNVSDIVYYPASATNPPSFYIPYLERVRAAAPQAIVLYCGSMTCFPMLEQARLMGMLQKPYAWILGNGLNTYSTRASIALIYPQLAQAITNNTVVMGVATAVDVSPVSVKYTKDILAYLGSDQLVNPFWSLFEYDAGLAWVHAAKKIIAAGQDPHNKSLFYSTLIALEFQGASGWVSFDENGDRFATSAIFRWCPGNDNLATIGNWTANGGVVIDPRWAPWSPAVTTGSGSAGSIVPAVVGGVVGGAGFLVVAGAVAGAFLYRHQRRVQRTLLRKIESDKNTYAVNPEELEIGRELGQGSYGAVFQAQWRGTEVAAKVVPMRRNEELDEEKLLQEVTVMKSLRHPNLLLFMCYAKTSEALTIVTEFMPRGSLLDVLADRAVALGTGLKLSILSDIAAGMAYLHGSSPPIVHCDLKSSNILMTASMQAKVSDFGLTVITHKHSSGTATQSDESVLGSLLWTAPEIISRGVFSTKSDVYAFGIMVWETVTRELPYRDMNPVLVSALVADKGSRPEVGPAFDRVQPLRDLMELCWDASPEVRPEFSDIIGSLGRATQLLRDLIKSERDSSVERPAPTGRMAIVFTAADIQQSTELWEWNAELMKEALYQHHDAMRAALRRNNGYEVMTQGDAFMILFQAAIDAVRFCVDAQRALVDLDWNPRLLEFPTCRCIADGDAVQFRGLRVRMGIHYGEPEANKTRSNEVSTSMTSGDHMHSTQGAVKSFDYIGPCVNKATRVASCGKGGQIVLSYAVAQKVQEEDAEALARLGKLHRVGAVQLQGIAQTEEIFDFAIAGLERQFADVHLSSVSELPHVPDAVQDLYERFAQTTAPSWAIAARDVEMGKEVTERGNFGIVFKGVWRSQTVAVKKFFRQKVDSITMAEIEHQIKEISLLSDIRHPNIVLFLGACTEPCNMFVVTEWMDNGSLLQLLSSSSQIDRQRGVAILTSTCSALTYLHQCNIVHRDLKSSNILLSKSMDVKVSDFGMAAVKTANKVSTLCGSIGWMAPEVLSDGTYTEASDVYSFGVVMNEILTCEVPFKGLNKVAVSREILMGRRPDIPKKTGGYPSQYVDLMCRCWDQQPSHRPAFKTISAELSTM
eukprot:m51a1_g399 putative serine threonine kinase (1307) ;mRNA; r:712954-718306